MFEYIRTALNTPQMQMTFLQGLTVALVFVFAIVVGAGSVWLVVSVWCWCSNKYKKHLCNKKKRKTQKGEW